MEKTISVREIERNRARQNPKVQQQDRASTKADGIGDSTTPLSPEEFAKQFSNNSTPSASELATDGHAEGTPFNAWTKADNDFARPPHQTDQSRLSYDVRPPPNPGECRVYLAGHWGFPDANTDNPSYGDLGERVPPGVPQHRKGFAMLQIFEKDLEATKRIQAVNPWHETTHPAFIDGVIFGEGKDLDGREWSHGNLEDRTMTRDQLLYWLGALSRLPFIDQAAAAYDQNMPMEELEQIYRQMIGVATYTGNKRNVEEADIVFANLNGYRADTDDGTLWEALRALELGKHLIVLVDKDPPKELGEGIFGKNFRHNAMVSGHFLEAQKKGQLDFVHTMDDAYRLIRDRAEDYAKMK